MPTPVHIVMDGCAMTLVYPSRMDMGMPYGGTVEGKAVSFIDGVNVDGCTGTIESPDSLSGSCSSGCTFVLAR